VIRKIISRVVRLGSAKHQKAGKAAVIAPSAHGISLESISPGARRVCEQLQAHGHAAFVVGGAVRDLLLGMPPKDFDVATDATPEEAKRILKRARIVGRRFPIVHAYAGREIIEVTTFRAQDENARTDEFGRVLRDNAFGSQAEDAARRDFTINALYFDPSTGCIHDYHHGVADLRQKTLRMIGDPKVRYREDPVRMLRAVRLSAKLGLAIDPEARKPIREMGQLLENVPPARLFDEIVKLLMSGHSLACLQALRAEGLHKGILPLLDRVAQDDKALSLTHLALSETDARIRDGRRASPHFMFAAIFWGEVVRHWEHFKARGENETPALHLAMNAVLDEQSEALALTRRVSGDIKDIWLLQPRFAQLSGKRPYALLEQAAFRAAWDFLKLRVRAGNADPELAEWWSAFLDADGPTRQEMLLPAQATAKKRRRRKKKPAASPAEAEAVEA
jgi:poly(A) polymerase